MRGCVGVCCLVCVGVVGVRGATADRGDAGGVCDGVVATEDDSEW